jgi:hypothetical protein
MMNCADKFLKHSERVGARFAEQNAGAQRNFMKLVLQANIGPYCRSYECCSFTEVKGISSYSVYCVAPFTLFCHHSCWVRSHPHQFQVANIMGIDFLQHKTHNVANEGMLLLSVSARIFPGLQPQGYQSI